MTPPGRELDELGLRFVLGETRLSALALGGVRELRATCRRMPWLTVLIAVIGALGALVTPDRVDAQPSAQPQINVARTIVGEPASQALLGIEIGPPEALPKKSFVSLRGLPPSASLTEGHAIGPGSWAVPLVALPTLKVNIPAGISGRADIVISLIGMDGRLLAEARTALVVGSTAMILSQEKAQPSPHTHGLPLPRCRPVKTIATPRELCRGRQNFRLRRRRAPSACLRRGKSTLQTLASNSPSNSSCGRRRPVSRQPRFGSRQPTTLSSFSGCKQ